MNCCIKIGTSQFTYTSWIRILQHLTFEINHRKWAVGGGGGGSCSFPRYEEASLPTQYRTKQCQAYFLSLTTYLSNIIISSTQTRAQRKSQEIINHKKHTQKTNKQKQTTNKQKKNTHPKPPKTTTLYDINFSNDIKTFVNALNGHQAIW